MKDSIYQLIRALTLNIYMHTIKVINGDEFDDYDSVWISNNLLTSWDIDLLINYHNTIPILDLNMQCDIKLRQLLLLLS